MDEQKPKPKAKRGFAAMSPEKQRELSRKGGAALRPEDRPFTRDKKLASEAGRKGAVVSNERQNERYNPKRGY